MKIGLSPLRKQGSTGERKGVDSRSRIKYGTSFAGMTFSYIVVSLTKDMKDCEERSEAIILVSC